MFRTGYTYIATYMCEALYDSAQIQLQPGPCLPLRHAHACSVVITKRGIPVSYRYSYIAPTYVWYAY